MSVDNRFPSILLLKHIITFRSQLKTFFFAATSGCSPPPKTTKHAAKRAIHIFLLFNFPPHARHIKWKFRKCTKAEATTPPAAAAAKRNKNCHNKKCSYTCLGNLHKMHWRISWVRLCGSTKCTHTENYTRNFCVGVCVFVVGRFVDNIRKQIFTTLFSLIFKCEYFHKATLACSMCAMLSMWDTQKLHGEFGRSRTA